MKRTFFAAAALLAVWGLAGSCKPISGQEDPNSIGNKKYEITKNVTPEDGAFRIDLLATAAREDELVEFRVIESEADQQYLDFLDVEVVGTEPAIKLDAYHQRDSDVYSFTMPNADILIRAGFSFHPSPDATLSRLVPATGTLVPAFNPNTTDYTLHFSPGTVLTQLWIAYATNHPGASTAATYNGLPVPSSQVIPIITGITEYQVVVLAQDRLNEKTYKIRIEKMPDAALTGVSVVSPDAPGFPFTYTGTAMDVRMDSYLPYVLQGAQDIKLALAPRTADPDATIVISGTGGFGSVTAYNQDIALGNTETKEGNITIRATADTLVDSFTVSLKMFRYQGSLTASGGTITKVFYDTSAGNWREAHIFNVNGTLTMNQNAQGQVFVVGGGGGTGGAYGNRSGGGGGGAVVNEVLAMDSSAAYTIKIGNGGGGGSWQNGWGGTGGTSFFQRPANTNLFSAAGGAGAQGTNAGGDRGSQPNGAGANIFGYTGDALKYGFSGGTFPVDGSAPPNTGNGATRVQGQWGTGAKGGRTGQAGVIVVSFPHPGP